MKTQIIKLEPHDDIISTRDKLNAAQANRVILIWPTKSGGIQNIRLDLTLLYRYSGQLGVQLGIVTTQDQVRQIANLIGIPVFRNLRVAQTDRWRPGRRRGYKKEKTSREKNPIIFHKPETLANLAWLQKKATKLVLFILSLAAVVSVIVVITPRAEIYFVPNRKELKLNLSAKAKPDLEAPSLAGEFPLRTGSIIVEGRQSIPASGEINIPEKPSVGKVEFTNLTEANLSVPAGTIVTTLETSAVRFITLDPITIPGGVGKKRSTNVQAQVPGSNGNLPAHTIKAIEGPLGLSLSVTNQTPTHQGSDLISIAPSDKDRSNLFTLLANSLKLSAAEELRGQFQQNGSIVDFPIIETLQLQQVIEETYSPEKGQPSEQTFLLLRLEFIYNFISSNDLQAFAETILDVNTPIGFVPVPGTQKIEHESLSNQITDGMVSWEMTLTQIIQEKVALDEVSLAVRGLSIRSAKKMLQSKLNLSESPGIKVSPYWWPFTPVLPYQIKVSFQSIDN